MFKENGLKIEIETNLKQVNFLDVTLNLNNGKFSAFRKPNSNPLYINTQSNHPPNIIREIPAIVNNRLSSISCDKEEFDKIAGEYQKALNESGYSDKLEFKPNEQKKKRNRKRKITWFNPPHNCAVKSNIGKQFLNIVEKHFPKSHTNKYKKIFNKDTLKLSYSCMPNMNKIISGHNVKVTKNKQEIEQSQCNCRDKKSCPLDNNCLVKSVIYKATITTKDGNKKEYIGNTGNSFKERYTAHKASIKDESKRHATKLSDYVWAVKDLEPKIKWEILKKVQPYQPSTRKCQICDQEKLEILRNKSAISLNSRNELTNKCPHARAAKLNAVKKHKIK